jgi:Zn-finger protein
MNTELRHRNAPRGEASVRSETSATAIDLDTNTVSVLSNIDDEEQNKGHAHENNAHVESIKRITSTWLSNISAKINASGLVRVDELPSANRTLYDRVKTEYLTRHHIGIAIMVITCFFLFFIWMENERFLHVTVSGDSAGANVKHINVSPELFSREKTPTSTFNIIYYGDDVEFNKKASKCSHATAAELAKGRFISYSKGSSVSVVSIDQLVSLNEHILTQEKGMFNFITPSLYLHSSESYYPKNHSIPCLCSLYTNEKAISLESKESTDRQIVHMINPHIVHKSQEIQTIKEKISLIKSNANTVNVKEIPECLGVSYYSPISFKEETIYLHKAAANRFLLCSQFMNDAFH